MSVYDQGGGGGKAGIEDTDLSAILSKPYDLSGGVNSDMVDQINQMFEELYRALRQTTASVTTQKLLGRYSPRTGPMQEITLGNGLTLDPLSGILSASSSELASPDEDTVGATNSLALHVAVKNLTDAQVKALNTTPITVIPAPGATEIAFPIFVSFTQQVTVAFSSNVTAQLRYADAAATATTAFGVSFTGTGHRQSQGSQSLPSGTFDTRGEALEIFTGSSPGPNGTTADGSRVVAAYVVFSVK